MVDKIDYFAEKINSTFNELQEQLKQSEHERLELLQLIKQFKNVDI